MTPQKIESLLLADREHVWHPYASQPCIPTPQLVESADGYELTLADGRVLIDGMASWWCVIHGYNHPVLNQALQDQLKSMAHVMFGGLTHEPAITLAQKLVEITPNGLDKVFFSDSGSVSVEVALKLAIQFWQAKDLPEKHRIVSLRRGYHGDTLGAMSVCDPVTGMHNLFSKLLPEQIFVESPVCIFGESCAEENTRQLREVFEQYHDQIAAIIVEPIVQGAGGMRFYSAEYLRLVRSLCDEYEVLLIADEIATGFGRSGKLFACEYASVSPDIMCLGKSLTGGYMTLAATLTTAEVSTTISGDAPGLFMHGPTFMANPLACSVSLASIDLLLESSWQSKVAELHSALAHYLEPCVGLPQVSDVRVLGAIGVVELHQPVNLRVIQPAFVEAGVWVRPFGRLVYLMPPYIIDREAVKKLCQAVFNVIDRHQPV